VNSAKRPTSTRARSRLKWITASSPHVGYLIPRDRVGGPQEYLRCRSRGECVRIGAACRDCSSDTATPIRTQASGIRQGGRQRGTGSVPGGVRKYERPLDHAGGRRAVQDQASFAASTRRRYLRLSARLNSESLP
jgi:hypothetical protein